MVLHIEHVGFLMVVRWDTHLGGLYTVHETLSEDIPSLTCTLCLLFLTLHKALQVSTGW